MLVVVDNASAEAQVRPLLPGAGPHRVLVTSRHTLAGLGARLLDVGVLDDRAAARLLAHVLRAAWPGDERITSDPHAARRLAAVCGGLPLALRITAALLAADPALTAAELAGQLSDEISRLPALRYDDGSATGAPSVAAAFDLSYRHLDETAARLFRLLPINPGPDISAAAAGALAGAPDGQTRTVLGRLARAHLVESGGPGRWKMHDLLRLFAGQLDDADTDVAAGTSEGEQARDRLLAYYLEGATAGDAHLRALPGTPVPGKFVGREQALAWLDAERPSLVTAVTMAARTSRDQVALDLPLRLSKYLSWRRRFDDWLTVLVISRDTARRLGDRHGEGMALNNLGVALRCARRFDEAIAAHRDAAAIFRETGDRRGEGTALNNLGLALRYARRFDEAIAAHRDAAAIFSETGDRRGEGMALGNLGTALMEVRRFDEAIAAQQDVAAIFRETGDRHSEGTVLNNLAWRCGRCGGLMGRSPPTRTPPRSSGRPATGTARAWR